MTMIPKPEICSGCPLCDTPGEPGFSAVEGLGTLRVHIVGEALGEKEEHDGLPFRPDAPAGSVLERAIRRAGFTRSQFTVHNIIRCRPPRNELEGAPYEDEAIHHCRRHFEAVVRDYPPGCILACGNVALRALTGMGGEPERQVGYLRGYVLDSEYGPVVSTFHPSYLRRGSSKFRDPSTGGKTKGTTGPGMALLGTLIHDLQRAVRVAAGLDTGFILHPEFDPKWFEDEGHLYIERPSLDDARAFESYVMCSGLDALLAYDLEHPRDRVEDPGDENEVDFGDEGRDIFSVQFWCQRSAADGKGIYLPWQGEYIEIAKRLFALPNPKAGHWNRKNDDPRLRSWGIIPAGRIEDLWEAFHHLQPDIPARLQNVLSYMYYSLHPKRGVYAPWPFPWKHWRGSDPERYGIVDVHTVAERLPILHEELKRAGLWSGYEQVYELQSRVFRGMSDRGIPVDSDVHAGLKADFAAERADLTVALRAQVPDAARTVHNPAGYERPPAIVRAAVIADAKASRVEGLNGETYTRQSGVVGTTGDSLGSLFSGSRELRENNGHWPWVQLRPFNPDSPQQVLAYIRAKGHPVPHTRGGKETTSDIELERLGRRTRDPVYTMIRDIRELRTMAGTFVEAWRPGPDGRAHPEFYTAPGTGQHSSKRPNALNVPKHGKLAGRFRKMIAARPGHRLVSFDWKSFHVLTLGFEARDADYCLHPSVRVLTSDLEWLPCKSVRIGDVLIAFDENGSGKSGRRKLRKSIVESVHTIRRPCLLVGTEQGSFICSAEHKWLARFSASSHYRWFRAVELRADSEIALFVKPWVHDTSWSAGWLARIADGEGSCTRHGSVQISQNPGIVLQELESELASRGFQTSRRKGSGKCINLCILGQYEGVRFLGTVRPARLLPKFKYEGLEPWGKRSGAVKVRSIEYIGESDVVAIGTSTNTLIAEGMLSHNCRMARLDMHTFVTSHFIKEPVDPTLPDEELRDRLKRIRAKHGKLRDSKVKHSVLGYQFGMGAKTLFERHREALSGINEARQLLSLIDALFPKAAAWRRQIVQVAHRQAYLLSRWGFIRYFWEVFRPDYQGSSTGGASGDDHEAAIAYLPANDAFGLRNAVMVRLEDSGANDRFGLINEIHDELLFEPADNLVEECLHVVRGEMERPDPVLSDPLVAPNGLWCGVEAKVGRNWGEMEEVR